MDEMLDIVLADSTHLKVPMTAVLQALGLDMQQAVPPNIVTRRMQQYQPGLLVELTMRMHPGQLRMPSLERFSE